MKVNILKLMIVMLNGLDAYSIAEFNPKFFWNRPPEDFYSVNMEMVDNTNEGLTLMAIGDMDNDKHTDLVTVNSNQDCFTVHYWHIEDQTYKPAKPTCLTEDSVVKHDIKIASIVISKDIKELQSLYIVYWLDPNQSQNTKLKVFYQPKRGVFKTYDSKSSVVPHSLQNLEMHANSQPFFLDINGDMIIDMVYTSPELNGELPKTMVAIGIDTSGEKFEHQEFSNFIIMNEHTEPMCKTPTPGDLISSPHSNSFLDLDGDCMPDIFLQKTHVNTDGSKVHYGEIYIQRLIKTEQPNGGGPVEIQKFCLQDTQIMLTPSVDSPVVPAKYDPVVPEKPAIVNPTNGGGDNTSGGGSSTKKTGTTGTGGGSKQQRVRSGASPEDQIPLVVFEDINRDGMMDIVFGFKDKIYVYYNLLDHKPFDPNSLDVVYLCLHWQETEKTQIFKDFSTLNEAQLEMGGSEHITIFDINSLLGLGKDAFVDSIADPLPRTFPSQGRVRSSDINIDGYPDLLVTLKITNTTTQTQQTQSFVLLNRPCLPSQEQKDSEDWLPECNLAQQDSKKRTFTTQSNRFNLEKVSQLSGKASTMLIPIDVDEDGRMDIIVQENDHQESLKLIYNNMNYDSYFIKAMMINQNSNAAEDSDISGLGATVIGASFRYVATDSNIEKVVRVASLQPQQSYHSLLLPYIYNGIGRSTNYIEQFNVAYSINNKLDQVRVYTPIIPNSYLMVLANKENYKSWQLDLFVNPNGILFQVCSAFAVVLIIMGAIIIMIHIQEKREDSKTGPQINQMF